MRKALSIVIATVIVCWSSAARQQQRWEYMDAATVKHRNGNALVTANDPRPLRQALCAVSQQHEWLVDYEDPPYTSTFDLVDTSDPQWRASHPLVRRMVIPAGGAFQFDYEEDPETQTSRNEEAVLLKMVSAYNRSGNPGGFEVRDEGGDSRPWSTSHKRYAIVGSSIKNQAGQHQQVPSILDTRISISTEQRSAQETIDLIAKELFNQTGTKIFHGAFANNLLIHSRVTVGGDSVPARTLLLQTLGATNNPSLIWSLMWDANTAAYALNIGVLRGCN